MKHKREHRVPLSFRAREILAEAKQNTVNSEWMFPSPTRRALPGYVFNTLLWELGVPAVPHGFRSSFRDWAAECTDAPHTVMEAALSHVVRNQVEAAYARSDLFERRRVLMERWAEFLVQGTARTRSPDDNTIRPDSANTRRMSWQKSPLTSRTRPAARRWGSPACQDKICSANGRMQAEILPDPTAPKIATPV